MADDNDDWLSGDQDFTAEEEAPPEAAAEEVPAGEAPAEGAAAEEELATPEEPQAEVLKKPKYFKHWLRPKFLNYTYLFDYRRNYYDDEIDFIEKKQKGISRDIPHAQTWAERALRTYTSKLGYRTASDLARDRDITLLSNIKTSGHFYTYHSKAYIHRKYSNYLY